MPLVDEGEQLLPADVQKVGWVGARVASGGRILTTASISPKQRTS